MVLLSRWDHSEVHCGRDLQRPGTGKQPTERPTARTDRSFTHGLSGSHAGANANAYETSTTPDNAPIELLEELDLLESHKIVLGPGEASGQLPVM